jgi:hypothetical protein
MRRLNCIAVVATAFVSFVSLGGCVNNPSVSPGNGNDPGNNPGPQGVAPPSSDPGPGGELAAGTTTTTFDHDLDERDPFDILRQKQEEGSPLVATRLHSCQKMSYAALGNLLASRGVDLKATAKPGDLPTAGDLYRDGGQALGAPNYAARLREPTQNTTAGATKLMDIFMQAAPEIIANMPNVAACRVNGQPTSMFDGSGDCTMDGVSCIIGAPATQQHVALCNQALIEASSRDIGQRIAVAALMAAAHTCQ